MYPSTRRWYSNPADKQQQLGVTGVGLGLFDERLPTLLVDDTSKAEDPGLLSILLQSAWHFEHSGAVLITPLFFLSLDPKLWC